MKTKIACTVATLAGLAVAAGFYGCTAPDGSGNQQVAAGAGSSSDAQLNISLQITDKTGAVVQNNQFAAKADVYLAIAPLTAGQAVTAQDYLFQVVDAQGHALSSDSLECRRFHVDASGNIDRVAAATDASGQACAHVFESVTINGQKMLIVALAPFEDVQKDAHGAMSFRVQVAPVDSCVGGVFPSNALVAQFTIQAQTATCGNGIVEPGEQCDDGNTVSGDGCSATCQSEGTHCCGNGVLDPGEQCDDGNTVSGDGCSSTCQKETPHAVCGNGVVEPGEQCDDGANNGKYGDTCTAQCHITHMCCCGNGHLDPGEQCDEGANNGAPGGTCTDLCQLTGNGSGSGSGSAGAGSGSGSD